MARKTFPLVLLDRTYLLDYDWPALGEIYKRFGATQDLFNPENLREIVVIGLRRHHPEVTAETIDAASPPIVKVVQVVDRALKYGYDGIDPDETDQPASALIPENVPA